MQQGRLDSLPSAADRLGLIGKVVGGRLRALGVRHCGPRSVVYEVEPPGVGRARRALKVLCVAEAREPAAIERLQSYIERLKHLQSDYLEVVYELGRLPDDTPYLLTEWLPERSAAWLLGRGGRLPLDEALELIRSVASGLSALHAAGLIHGDVGPHHVLIRRGGAGFERVALIDCGVTTRLQTALPRGVHRTLAYLSPEQVGGRRATPASDVYALGALAYQALTGTEPFDATDPRARVVGADPAARLRWLHLNALPIRPSSVAIGPEVPAPLEAVIGRALAKSPAARFPDAGAFLEALHLACRKLNLPLLGLGLNETPLVNEPPGAAELTEEAAIALFAPAPVAEPIEPPVEPPPIEPPVEPPPVEPPPAEPLVLPPALHTAEPLPTPLWPLALAGLLLGAAVGGVLHFLL